MKTAAPISAARSAAPRWSPGARTASGLAAVGLLFALTQGASGCAVADVQTQAISAPITAQEHRPVGTHTEITRYPDGHQIITRDGTHTDITIQRLPPAGPALGWPAPDTADGRFDPPELHERFGSWPRGGTTLEPGTGSAREAFRQRMLDRLGNHP